MYIQIGLIVMVIFFTIIPGISFGQTNQSSSQYFTPSRDKLASSESEKIDEVLIKWQNSENPVEYAKKLDLAYKEDKIVVYIYLENPEYEQKIPLEIEKISANKNIIRAFVTPDELYELGKLDFVTKITLPTRAENLPISQEQSKNLVENNSYFWILVPIILVMIAIVAFKTKNKFS